MLLSLRTLTVWIPVELCTVFVDSVSLPSFSSCCLCRFLVGVITGEFSVLCQCLVKICQCCTCSGIKAASPSCIDVGSAVHPCFLLLENKVFRFLLWFSCYVCKAVWRSWHFGDTNVEVESLLIRTKCQFDITWHRLLSCYERHPPNEVTSHHTPCFEQEYDKWFSFCYFCCPGFLRFFLFKNSFCSLPFTSSNFPSTPVTQLVCIFHTTPHPVFSPPCFWVSFTCLHLISLSYLISFFNLQHTPTCHQAFPRIRGFDVFVRRHPNVLVTALLWCSSWVFVCLPPTATWSSLAMSLPQENHSDKCSCTYVDVRPLSVLVFFKRITTVTR